MQLSLTESGSSSIVVVVVEDVVVSCRIIVETVVWALIVVSVTVVDGFSGFSVCLPCSSSKQPRMEKSRETRHRANNFFT